MSEYKLHEMTFKIGDSGVVSTIVRIPPDTHRDIYHVPDSPLTRVLSQDNSQQFLLE